MDKLRVGREILFSVFGESSYVYQDAFPLYHVNPTSPPHFLINAERDYTLKRHALDYFFVLKENGVYVQSKVYKNTNHFTIRLMWDSRNQHVLKDIVHFIQNILIKLN